jgi:hypothetical protein
MAIPNTIDQNMTVLNPERITVSFTEVELSALRDLLHKACELLLQTGTGRAPAARPN